MDYAAIGKRVLKIRKYLDLSQVEFSKRIGISLSFLGHIERGTRVMSIETLFRIAKAGGCSADYLLGLTEVQNCMEECAVDLLERAYMLAKRAMDEDKYAKG